LKKVDSKYFQLYIVAVSKIIVSYQIKLLPVLISGITHWLVQALCRTLNRRREMNEVKRNQIRAIAFAGLQDAVKNGFNGAISAGGGSFNDLCGKIALRTGADFQIVQQIVAPIWDDMLEYVRIPGLDQYENWHEWNIPART